MRVKGIRQGSIAEELGIAPGDNLVSINNHKISDFLDYLYHSENERILLLIKKKNELIEFDIEKDEDEDLGLNFEPTRIRPCANKCIFCFVDQLPSNLRQSLYFKDGDYRFSFSDGNFVTLTNVGPAGLKRIAEYRLSPIYISVHTTNVDLRKKMLGLKKDDHILDKIHFLNRHDIEMHLQIVLCPGWNDGKELEKTIADLYRFRKNIRSLAIVPVGLTKHRHNLMPLKPVTSKIAQLLIEKDRQWEKKYKNSFGERFIYLADEFFLLAGEELPDSAYYGGFYQIENGVGLTRDFLERFYEEKQTFPDKLPFSRSISIATGELAAAVFRKYILPELNSIGNLSVHLIPVKNRFLGDSITVAGLLSGSDFHDILKGTEPADELFLPPRAVNHENQFLDNWTPQTLEKKLQRQIILTEDFKRIIQGNR